MATEKDLINAVRDSLDAEGELGRMKSEMRNKVMKLLDDSASSSHRIKLPDSPRDVILLNELIREYLDWIGYKYTSSVLVSECELGKQPLNRAFLKQDLGMTEEEETRNLPLLFCLIETFKDMKSATQNERLETSVERK